MKKKKERELNSSLTCTHRLMYSDGWVSEKEQCCVTNGLYYSLALVNASKPISKSEDLQFLICNPKLCSFISPSFLWWQNLMHITMMLLVQFLFLLLSVTSHIFQPEILWWIMVRMWDLPRSHWEHQIMYLSKVQKVTFFKNSYSPWFDLSIS